MARHATIYRCPACGQQITLLITPCVPPTCSRHTGGGKKMEKLPNER